MRSRASRRSSGRGSAAVMVWSPAWISMVRQRRAVRTKLLIAQPVWAWIQRLTERAPNATGRWASMESRWRWEVGRSWRPGVVSRQGFSSSPVGGADHDLRGHGRAVRAGPQVGDVALQPGQVPRLGFQLPVDGGGAGGELDEPIALEGHLPGDGFLGLGDLLIDAAQGAPRP